MDPQHPPTTQNHLPPTLTELRLVLLGRKGAGKSAAGNTFLGGAAGLESGKPTEECVKRRADVVGRKVTVVDTPGWEWYYPLNSTPNWVRRETLRSVSLCPPGPHAVLLVVRACASVTQDYIREIEEHLEPLGEGVWEHTMLLFTRGDELGLMSMEHRISSCSALQGLLQKCGNRYHVVDNRSKGDGTQVTELIRKLEEMVEKKTEGSKHLEMGHSALLGLEADGKRRARERRKKQRQMEEQVQRGTIKAALMSDGVQSSELDAHHSFSKAPRRLPEIRLVLLGERETGKSSAGNTILGKTGAFQSDAVTEECSRQQAEVATRMVTVVDTPGWEGGIAGATPERVKREIINSVAFCPPGPHALLLTLRVDTLVRAGHVTEHLELLGEGVWRHIILLFTHGDQLREGVDIGQHIQGGGRDLQWLLEKCRGRYQVISSLDKGCGGSSMVADLLQKVEKMAAMNRCEAFSGLVHEVRDLSRQRNEKFNQRLKEIGDKMQRQDVELKNMREREMKSIRWIFDRKKKIKSPGKASIQKEDEVEDEDRKVDERQSDIVDLEERMRWLTEDKERECQDLSLENERLCVSLKQSKKEKDKGMLNLEMKELEIEELQERLEEQQIKLINIEHAGKQKEDAVRAEKQQWMSQVKELEGSITHQEKEKGEWMEKVESLKNEMDKAKSEFTSILERRVQEQNREMAMLKERLESEMKSELLEKDKQQEDLRKKASEEKQEFLEGEAEYERRLLKKVEEINALERKMHKKEEEIQAIKMQHKEEIESSRKMMENIKVQQEEELDRLLKDSNDNANKVKKLNEKQIRDLKSENQRVIAEMKEKFAKDTQEQKQAKEKEIAELEQKYLAKIDRTSQENENEKERIQLNYKKDIAEMMQEKKIEADLHHKEEIARIMNDMERLMEAKEAEHKVEIHKILKEQAEVVEKVREECRDQVRAKEQDRHRQIQELKEEFTEEIQRQTQEKQREMKDLEAKCAARTEEKMQEKEKEKVLMIENHKRDVSEKMQENEKEKVLMIENHKGDVLEKMQEYEREKVLMTENHKRDVSEKMQEKDRQIEELKHQHSEEIEELKREKKKETERFVGDLEQRLKEKDKEVEEIRVNMREMREKLQQKEEKEADNLREKSKMEQKLGDKEDEIHQMKSNLVEVQERLQKKEEEERDHSDYKKEMEQKLEEKEQDIKVMEEQIKELEQQSHQANEKNERELLNFKRQVEQKLEEKERLIEKLNQHISDIDEILQRKDEERGEIILIQKREAEKRLQDKEREMEEMKQQLFNDMERKSKEKESEIESLKQQAALREERWKEEQKKKDEKGESEINRLLEVIETKSKEITQAESLCAEKESKFESTCAGFMKEIEELKETTKSHEATLMERQQKQTEEAVQNTAEMAEKLKEKYEEVNQLRQKDHENEKEIAKLRLTIEQTKSELKELTNKMEKEMTSMIQGYEKEILQKNENMESIVREKDCALSCLEEQSRQRVSDTTEKFEESQRKVEELQEQNEKMRKEMENLKIKFEELKKNEEQNAQRVKNREGEIESILNDRDREIQVLKEANGKMKDQKDEAERNMNDLLKKQSESIAKYKENEEELSRRDEDVTKREQTLIQNQEELTKRDQELDAKEEELVERKGKLESKEEELCNWEANLKKQQKVLEETARHTITKAQTMMIKERELDSLLGALEGKQRELSCHGQDLQKKVKGLKDHGKELKDREYYLKNEEQELLNWKSELNMQNEHVNSTTQELDDMRRDLALLKEELCNKERNLKASFEKLRRWEENVKDREDSLNRNDSETGPDAAESSENVHSMYGEVSKRRGKGRGREGTEDQIETTVSSAKSDNCHLETLNEMETSEEEEEIGEGQERVSKKHQRNIKDEALVTQDLLSLSPRQGQSSSDKEDLSVLVLGESWSSCSSSGVCILSGEAPKLNGPTFRSWQGQTAGRSLEVVEPLGLKWRDGPDPVDLVQTKNIHDSLSLCHPGPHVVILLLPSFMTCTPKYRRAIEEHMSLLGEEIWQRTMVLFTSGELLGESAEQHILRNGELARLVERCGGRHYVMTSKKSNSKIEGLFHKIEEIVYSN